MYNYHSLFYFSYFNLLTDILFATLLIKTLSYVKGEKERENKIFFAAKKRNWLTV